VCQKSVGVLFSKGLQVGDSFLWTISQRESATEHELQGGIAGL